jgi:glycosidase
MGDNIYLGDRDGVRTPMQWSSDRNAGFSRCDPQALCRPIVRDPIYPYEAVNVETQERLPTSLLWWTKRADRCPQGISRLRPRYPSLPPPGERVDPRLPREDADS